MNSHLSALSSKDSADADIPVPMMSCSSSEDSRMDWGSVELPQEQDVPPATSFESLSSFANSVLERLRGLRSLNDASSSFSTNKEQETDTSSTSSSGSSSEEDKPDIERPKPVVRPPSIPPPKTEPVVPELPHIVWWIHGKVYTCLALLVALVGLLLTVLARQSTSFVQLGVPIYIDGNINALDELGLLRLRLCYNETATSHDRMSGCFVTQLSVDDLEDTKFEVGRLLVGVVAALDVLWILFLLSSIFWRTIKMRALAVAFLITYVLHACSFLLFDSETCKNHHCSVSQGCYLSIFGSLCWIVCAIVAAKMDYVKYRVEVEYQKRQRRKLRRQKQQRQQLERQKSRRRRRSSSVPREQQQQQRQHVDRDEPRRSRSVQARRPPSSGSSRRSSSHHASLSLPSRESPPIPRIRHFEKEKEFTPGQSVRRHSKSPRTPTEPPRINPIIRDNNVMVRSSLPRQEVRYGDGHDGMLDVESQQWRYRENQFNYDY